MSTNLESGISAVINAEYELVALDTDIVTIKGVAQITSSEQEMEVNGIQTQYDLEGKVLSNIKINRSTGWIKEGTADQSIGGTITMKAGPSLPSDMQVPLDINTTTEITD